MPQTSNYIGSNVTFTVLSVGLDLSYEWEFGDGSKIYKQTPPILFTHTHTHTHTAFPTVLVQPESIQNAVPGSTVTFTLTASNAISYNWVLNEGFYLEDTGRHVGTTTNTLTINNVNKLDEGTYHCIVMRELSVATDLVTLTVCKFGL